MYSGLLRELKEKYEKDLLMAEAKVKVINEIISFLPSTEVCQAVPFPEVEGESENTVAPEINPYAVDGNY